MGPFEAAQQQFLKGQVILLCAGWFGKVGRDFDKMVGVLAKAAAASDDGMSVSPLHNLNRKGGAAMIMRQQFRRAIGVAIVRGNAKLKLARLHYVRASAAEASQVCEANHSEKGWQPHGRRHPSWFAAHVTDGYGTFEQFINGRDNVMP